jgi:hypothetical protein
LEKKTERSRISDDIKLIIRKEVEREMGKGKVICKIFDTIENYAELDCPLL